MRADRLLSLLLLLNDGGRMTTRELAGRLEEVAASLDRVAVKRGSRKN